MIPKHGRSLLWNRTVAPPSEPFPGTSRHLYGFRVGREWMAPIRQSRRTRRRAEATSAGRGCRGRAPATLSRWGLSLWVPRRAGAPFDWIARAGSSTAVGPRCVWLAAPARPSRLGVLPGVPCVAGAAPRATRPRSRSGAARPSQCQSHWKGPRRDSASACALPTSRSGRDPTFHGGGVDAPTRQAHACPARRWYILDTIRPVAGRAAPLRPTLAERP